MLTFLIKSLMYKYIPRKVTYAEDIIQGGKEDAAATLCLTQGEIYNSMYTEAKDLFRDVMKAGQLSREQILYLKLFLRNSLKDYREFYNSRYKNDAHEIYTLLKSPFLSNVEYTLIINTIKRFIHSNRIN